MNQPTPEEFFQACQARGPLVLEIERAGQHGTVRHTLSLPFAVIGRDERADLRLDDKRISNRHAYLQVVAGQLWFIDLGSRAGTHGQPSQPPTPLRRGQELRIDPFVLRLAASGSSGDEATSLPNPLTKDSYDPSAMLRVSLDFLEGTVQQPQWIVNRVLTLMGSSALCKVRLRSPTVSRTHCALLHTPAGLWVVDLLGREGIRVNDALVRWARLEDADELRIGEFLVRTRFIDRGQETAFSTPIAQETARMTTALLPPIRSLVPSAAVSGLPTDLEGLLSALPMVATPSPVTAIAGGTTEALLLPMVRQFALMQQQMFDQFQQVLMMMMQTFTGLHRDQLQLIRQELNQLSEVTRELQSLQAEQARQAMVSVPTESGSPVEAKTDSPSQPAAPPLPKPPEETVGVTPPSRPSDPAEKMPPQTAGAGRSDPDVHAWLAQRLATLQQERQSRWQKILHVLTGK